MINQLTINNQPLEVMEYNNQRVVTFAAVDRIHNRPEGTARKRFNDNKQHFIENEDYFTVSASEIRTHEIADVNANFHGSMIFLTKFGYLLLVKSLTDNLAWRVQKELVKSYFESHNPIHTTNNPILEREVHSLSQLHNSLTACVTEYGYQIRELLNRLNELELNSKNNSISNNLISSSASSISSTKNSPNHSVPLIQQFIQKRNDKSIYGAATYRIVYQNMYSHTQWKRMATRYKNQYGTKALSKTQIVNSNAKALSLFNKTICQMMGELKGER